MAIENPESEVALAEIAGVGPKKLADYGPAFLRELGELKNSESPLVSVDERGKDS